ncbi:hypothetical protein SAY87_013724 [Trapa incisa]|uniref:Uncharacterized protein n=1 Tax=Trapa incisa TaxID=236973 RepID=A0AAN7KHT9_9MYRT|nr:hypothetical protein SAY87_013724 [Trapa incisa]
MVRSYLPSKVSEIVSIWRKDLKKVNPKAAESLADPEEYPNLFDDWQVALSVESRVAEKRAVYPPATDYVNYKDRSNVPLVEAFRNMQIEEEQEPMENGDTTYESAEEKGEEKNVEEAVVVDADSTDGVVLVNGNEGEEE